LKSFVDEGNAKYEKIHKETKNVHNNLTTLKEWIVIYRWHKNDVQNLIGKIIRGVGSRRGLQPQPLLLLKDVDPISRTCVTLENCAFYGLRFAHVWGVQFVSCKHVYHDWCVVYHFGTSSKCIQQGCKEEMHEAWWRFVGLKKPSSLVSIEDGGTDTVKLLAQRFWAHHGSAILLVSFIQWKFKLYYYA